MMDNGARRWSMIVLAGWSAHVILAGGCKPRFTKEEADAGRSLTVYCAVDQNAAQPILERFEQRWKGRLHVVYDTEAGKTTTLVSKILAESKRPRADVYWSGELFQTLQLADQNLLEPYDPPAAHDIPDGFRDPARSWTAFGMRARVLAFEPSRIRAEELPEHWEQLAEARFAKRLAFANPLFGTTRGHVAAAFALWGQERARRFLQGLRDGGALMTDGNSSAVRAVINGQADMAITDSDDVWAARRSGSTLESRHLDMGDGGTLWIPCSVAIVRGGPRVDQARKLVDYLVSGEVERLLAESDLRTVPVRESLRVELGLELPPQWAADYASIVTSMEPAAAAVREILVR